MREREREVERKRERTLFGVPQDYKRYRPEY